MAKNYQNKTIRATAEGLIISYANSSQKNQFIRYENTCKKEVLSSVKKYQQNAKTPLNAKQKQLYNEVLYGFSSFSEQELSTMSEKRKLSIMINYTKANRIIRNYKQDVLYPKVDDLLTCWFPNSSMVKKINSCTTKDGYLPLTREEDTISCEEVGLTQHHIFEKLIEYKILPKNFYQLT